MIDLSKRIGGPDPSAWYKNHPARTGCNQRPGVSPLAESTRVFLTMQLALTGKNIGSRLGILPVTAIVQSTKALIALII